MAVICNYEASAGTGKTYTIKVKFAELVLRGIPVDSILAMTYTEAAAAEMRDRIRKTLEETLDKGIKDGTLTDTDRIRLRAALTGLGDAWICTIHGFCARVLKEYPFEAGVNCRMKVDNTGFSDKEGVSRSLTDNLALLDMIKDEPVFVDELKKHDFRLEKITALVQRIHFEYGDTLNGYDIDFEVNTGGPREARFRQESDEEYAAAMAKAWETFRKTVEEYREKKDEIAAYSDINIKAINSISERADLCEEIKAGKQPQLNKSNSKLSISDSQKKVLDAYDKYHQDDHIGKTFPEVIEWINNEYRKDHSVPMPDDIYQKVCKIRDAVARLKYIRNDLVANAALRLRNIFVWILTRDAVKKCRDIRLSKGVMNYDDMIELVARALEEPDNPLGKALREKFAAGIVDEFQDTDPLQWRIIDRIFPKGDEEGDTGAKKRRLILAGDPKQSIYGFRGANISTYIDAVSQEGTDRKDLPVSNRFTPNLCHALNRFFASQFHADSESEGEGGEDKPPVDFFGEGIAFKPAGFVLENDAVLPEGFKCFNLVRLREEAPAVRNETADDAADPENSEPENDKPDTANPEAGETDPPDDKKTDDKKELSRYYGYICDEIQRIVGDDRLKFHRKKDEDSDAHPRYGDFMVLVKARRDAEPLEKLFREKCIPYTFYKKNGLFTSEEAVSLYETLLAVYEPSEEHFKVALFGDLFRMSPESIGNCIDGKSAAEELRLLQSWADKLAAKSPGEAADAILSELKVHTKSLEEGDTRRSANYKQLAAAIRAMSQKTPDPRLLLAALKTRMDEGGKESEDEDEDLMALDTDRDVVKITTMHGAKGLEANVVFLLGSFMPKSYDKTYGPMYDKTIYTISGKASADYYSDVEQPTVYLTNDYVKNALTEQGKHENHRLLYVAMTRARALLYMLDNPSLYEGVVVADPDNSPDAEEILYTQKRCADGRTEYVPSSEGEEGRSPEELVAEYRQNTPLPSADAQPAPAATREQQVLPEKAESLPEYLSCIWLQSFSGIRSKGGKAETEDSGKSGAAAGEPAAEGQDPEAGRETADGDEARSGAAAEEAEEIRGGSDEPEDTTEDREGELPGGTVTGNIVHEAFDAIFRHPDVKKRVYYDLKEEDIDEESEGRDGSLFANECLSRILDRYSGIIGRRRREYRRGILTILRNTLRTPLWEGGPEIGKLDTKYILTERPFVFKRKDAARDKVFYNGVVDMIFMHEGAYYVLDWKTNRSPSREYGQDDLAGMMAEGDYKKQAGLYTCFVDKWLQNFREAAGKAGGAVSVTKAFYVFVRPAEKRGGGAAVFEVSREELDAAIKGLLGE